MTDSPWRKSTYSGGSGGSCVEVASDARVIQVRDTKQDHMGDRRTIVGFTPSAWTRFTASLR